MGRFDYCSGRLILTICAVGLIMTGEMSEASTDCTYEDTGKLAESLLLGASFESVVSELDATKADYSLGTDDQELPIDFVRRKGFEALGPIRITIKSNDKSREKLWSILKVFREDELLVLYFDNKGDLAENSCKRIATGW